MCTEEHVYTKQIHIFEAFYYIILTNNVIKQKGQLVAQKVCHLSS